VSFDCSLCGVKMLDLYLCLSANVNVRYNLHTQPLRIIYQSLSLGITLSIFVSIHPLLDYLSHPQHLLLLLHAIPSPPLVFLFLSHQPLLF
jgi:hypothetical protein